VTELLAPYLPSWLTIVASSAIGALLVVSFIGLAAFLFIWGERKVSARMQDRLGPTRTGPFGLLQSLADGIKLVTKEDVAPDGADRMLHRIAPYMAFAAAFCGFIALPFGVGLAVEPLGTGAFFMLAALSSEVFGVILAGYASGSKWSLFGGLREAAQVVSYEAPRSLCVLVPICVAGSLNLHVISQQQMGGIWNWNLFHDPFTLMAFVLFFVVATAGCKRAPFDLAEAESELVAGFLTEYSGMRWSYFFLAEYGSMVAVSGLAAILFLGGWHTGFLPFEPTERFGVVAGNAVNCSVFVGKASLLVLVMMWLRWTLPRLRIDQVMMVCLKYFLPISCALLVGVCLWQLTVPSTIQKIISYALAAIAMGGLAIYGAMLMTMSLSFRSTKPGGVWVADRSAAYPTAAVASEPVSTT
jgi:NADH-quinone oxidoreductase subunit H